MFKSFPLWLLFSFALAACSNDSSTSTDADADLDPDTDIEAQADFYTPAPIKDALLLTRSVAWSELATVPVNLTRFTMGEAGGTDILLLSDTGNSVDASLNVELGLAAETTVSDDVLLRSMFKFIEEDDGSFRIVSTKHSNYALDIDDSAGASALILRDVRSGSRDESLAGYLKFTISAASPLVLTASARMEFNAASSEFENVDAWVSNSIILVDGVLSLTTGAGTSMTLYESPINFDVPFDFNPDETTRVSNPEVDPVTTSDDPVARTANDVVAAYSNQVTAAGESDETTAAAVLMIATIEITLASESAQLRYPAEFYMAFRAGLFSREYQSSDSTDGVLGQLTVPYVYFTNEADDEGVHHPFMVIASYGLPDSLTLLWDVAKPPGDGLVQEYANQSVTRSIHREAFLMKIPMRDYGEVTSLTENEMVNDLASDVNETTFDHHNYASVSATGVAIDGVVIYPSYNNSLHVAQTDAELSAHGMHSGRGLGAHYHADAHSATGEGLNLYNASDYSGHSHPPIVSIGFDGVAGYGVYQAGDASSDGVSVSLDSFGGHEHDAYAYHYHSFTQAETTSVGNGPGDPAGGVSYTAHQLPPLGAWSGRINDIPEFWDGTAPNYVGGRSVYLGTQ